ncbi:NAD(P)H-hydrate dehydratase [Ottowia sp.]|uniref:NAD(P)H-hydrate dehydratase n=1 Tax=Ottowia sp. TaxID=1898956 RepID=UPI003A85FDCB
MPQTLDITRALPLYDTAATRRMEQAVAAALPPHTLMQRAGLAIARLAMALAPHARRVWIACGPGNNGGDGLEAAMHLQRWGLQPVVTWLGTPDAAPADARASWQRAMDIGVRFADTPPGELAAQDLCIDALLGIGTTRPPEGRMADWLHALHAVPAPLLAVDLPTGLHADTGAWHTPESPQKTPESIAGGAFHTSAKGQKYSNHPSPQRHTLSLLTLKPGLFTAHGRDACGQIWFDDLGADSGDEVPTAWLNGAPSPAPRLHASHKGTHGDVAVIGGEIHAAHNDHTRGTAMAGAALLAARAALHGGAGRVYVSLLGQPNLTCDVAQPELMFRPPTVLPLAQLTVVCGCGGGTSVASMLPAVLHTTPRLVLDADALNAIAADPADLQPRLRARAVHGHATALTPHPLEAARLLGINAADVQADRLHAAQALAERFECVVVLKGSGTIIAAPNVVPHINPTGNARLATAGTGDVLAGLIGARLAAGLPAFEAACAAVWQHGAAADRWAKPEKLTASLLASA